MSRLARFFVVCLIVGIFLFSYGVDLFAIREVAPGREASWVRIRVLERDSRRTEVSMGLPARLVEMFLTSPSRASSTLDIDGEELDLGEIWMRLRDTDRDRPLEFGDDGDLVQVWLE